MSDPPRLLEQSSTNASTLELLRALEPPQAPPSDVRASLVKDLSGLVAGSSVKAAAAATWLKLALVGALGVGAAGAFVWSQTSPSPSVPAPAHERSQMPAPQPNLPQPAEPAVAPAPPPVAVVPEPRKGAASAVPRDSLAEEESLLEAARQAVASDPGRALSLLQKHRAQFPSGQLSAERMYLSVDCWRRLGNLAAAKREAAALTKYYPNSAYARRAPLLLASPAR